LISTDEWDGATALRPASDSKLARDANDEEYAISEKGE